MNCLKAQHITQQFGSNKVLNNVSISLQTGDVIGLFGRNGSGKSTLLKILFGVLKNTGFSLDIDGNRILQKQIVPLKKIGYLPQDSFLPKRITVRNLIPMIFPDGKLQELLFYRKGIAKFEKQRIGELSIGQRKYLELLLLSHMEHPFLLLDEPFSMVEPLYKEEIKGLLEEIKLFKGMIITDHYYHDVFEVSSQNYVLKEGSLTAVFSEEDLKKYNYLRSD
ncbi:MAG: ABC transporter ATP-binding protein [Alteromonas sp.]|nr:ABC transporter ATP-binding protein [Alteromonas sp.]